MQSESKNEAARRRYHARVEHFRNKRKQTKADRLSFLREQLGDACEMCGSKDKIEWDHINPALKPNRLSVLSRGIETTRQELDNLRPLCHTCHVKISTAQKRAAWQLLCNLPLDEQQRLINEQL